MQSINEIFARRLKQARLEAGLTQLRMSEMLFIHESTFRRYEYARSQPAFETLMKIAKALNVSTDWLLGLK